MIEKRPYVESLATESAQTLRARFAEYGYLFFRGFVAAAECEQLLQRIVSELQPHIGWDESAREPCLVGEPFYETDPVWDEVYPRIQALEEFHNFFHTEAIGELMTQVTGKPPFVYPIKMARISTPGKIGYETPPHQDAHSHHAGPTMAGIWVALHDVRQEMGRVMVLPGSHKGGVRPVHETQGVGGVQCEIYPDETTWHVSDYGQGDVLVFHSAMVHRAEPNTANTAVRLSVDTRFCDYGAPVFSTNIEPHHGWRIEGLDWEHIYQNWRGQDLRYYWKDYPGLF